MSARSYLIYSLFVLFVFQHCMIVGQNYSDYIIDTNYIRYRDSVVDDFCKFLSDYTGEKNDFFAYSLVVLGPNATYVKYSDNFIDTSAFSKQYFCSGKFIVDYVHNVMAYGRDYKFVYHNILCDFKSKRCYEFPIRQWISRNKEGTINPEKYLWETYAEKYFLFIGNLLKEGVLDCLFSYPLEFDYYENIVFIPTEMYFGIKNNDIYVVYEDLCGNNFVRPMEEFINCCWDIMSNVRLK